MSAKPVVHFSVEWLMTFKADWTRCSITAAKRQVNCPLCIDAMAMDVEANLTVRRCAHSQRQNDGSCRFCGVKPWMELP